jgi:hypothetical protein
MARTKQWPSGLPLLLRESDIDGQFNRLTSAIQNLTVLPL